MGSWSVCTHPPYVRDGEDERCARLEARGAPGERVSLSFDLVAADSPVAVAVSTSPLTAGDVDVHVVAVRDQAGIGVHRGAPVAVPELLLKDDAPDLRGHYARFCGHLRHVHGVRHGRRFYVPPDVRLAGDVRASLAPRARRQVWVTVQIRSDAVPGTHTTTIEVRDGSDRGESIPLTIEVLPIVLRDPPQRRMLWFRGTLDCRRPQFYLAERVFLRQLQYIRAHGFTTVSLGESSRPLMRRALALARTAGFTSVVLQPPLPADLSPRDLDGVEAICYASDEIDQRGPAWYPAHRDNVRRAARLGLPTMASFVRERFAARLPALDLARPDHVSIYLPANPDYFRVARAFGGLGGGAVLYYWMAAMEKPNVHRVLAGWYLWNSGAAGIAPYCYQHLPRCPNDPYDDFDEWDPEHAGAGEAAMKDQLATYPARSGPVPTLQWEGLAEGITDLRYIATVEHLVAGLRERCEPRFDALCANVEARLHAMAAWMPLAALRIADDTEAEPYAHLDARDYARFRHTLAEDAAALSAECAPVSVLDS